MRPIGFSTGALACGDFQLALEMIERHEIKVVEFSALRECEFEPLLTALGQIDLTSYTYVSFHAPSLYEGANEKRLIQRLAEHLPKRFGVILHPDAAEDLKAWGDLGSRLLVENMDKRKSTGRSVSELRRIFERLPEARFCFDLGHARQVDPTFIEARRLLEEFAGRLAQVHISEVNTASRHERISLTAAKSYQQTADLIPVWVPVIIEAPVKESEMQDEISRCREALNLSAPAYAATA